MVFVVAQWKFKSDDFETIKNHLQELKAATRTETGNITYDYYFNDDQTEIALIESYEDEAALAAHRAEPHFQRLVLETIVPLLISRSVRVLREG